MSRTSWKQKYRNLRIRHLKLEAKYCRLKAKMLTGEPLKVPDMVDKKRYLELKAKYKRLQAKTLQRIYNAS